MMKLGSQTGSLTNHILSRAVIGQPEPVLGMGCTLLSWTDRHAATIVGVFKETKTIKVRQDLAKRTDNNGMSESQTYEYSADLSGMVLTYRQDKNGHWQQVEFNTVTKRFNKTDGYGLRIGEREEYHDFSF